jgi:hypothetical protein
MFTRSWLAAIRKQFTQPQTSRRPKLAVTHLEERETPARVIAASPEPFWSNTPFTQLDLTFDVPIIPASLQKTDLTLTRNGPSIGTVTSATFLPNTNNQVVRFTVTGVTTPGNLVANLPLGAVTDINNAPNPQYQATYILPRFRCHPWLLSAARFIRGLRRAPSPASASMPDRVSRYA